jgi:hypothetical protein
MSQDQELSRWQSEWQSMGGREDLAKELSLRVVRDGNRIRRGLAIEVAGGLFAGGLSIALMIRMRGDAVTTVVCAGVLVLTGVWTTRIFALREGSLRATAEGLDTFVALTRRRLDDDLRWLVFGSRAMQVFAALNVPWAVWALVARWETYSAEPWRGIVGFGTAGLILAATFLGYRKKRRSLLQDRERFEALVAERDVT